MQQGLQMADALSPLRLKNDSVHFKKRTILYLKFLEKMGLFLKTHDFIFKNFRDG
jgi:hypothetical protein